MERHGEIVRIKLPATLKHCVQLTDSSICYRDDARPRDPGLQMIERRYIVNHLRVE